MSSAKSGGGYLSGSKSAGAGGGVYLSSADSGGWGVPVQCLVCVPPLDNFVEFFSGGQNIFFWYPEANLEVNPEVNPEVGGMGGTPLAVMQ